MRILLVFLVLLVFSCQSQIDYDSPIWKPYNEDAQLLENKSNENVRMQYKLIQSKYLDKNDIWAKVAPQISDFTDEMYSELKPFIFEQDIQTIQHHIENGEFNYKQLVQWYLYRIVLFENDSTKTLHTIIDINPNAVKEAELCDSKSSDKDHHIFGMPILLKDNIDTKGILTTAGAMALSTNIPNKDAFIVENIKSKGGIILGKVNLSEWAYYFCDSCPLGYSAIGGQTLNPYGPRVFETGGSSAGSGTAMAANYAVAAVGTETSGSILSPSSLNSLVGLKPTIGLLSRNGIVPISSTLDTPGPMTRNVSDNMILLSAMLGQDNNDAKSFTFELDESILYNSKSKLSDYNLIVIEDLFESDSIYKSTVEKIMASSKLIESRSFEQRSLAGFLTLLNLDMREDLPQYLGNTNTDSNVKNVNDIMKYNLADSLIRMPYGQARFEGIINDTFNIDSFPILKENLMKSGQSFFAQAGEEWDAILSINNYHASYAAVAEYPCITLPMGYKESGEPVNLTFIGKPKSENTLYKIAAAFEKLHNVRQYPKGYN